MHDAVSTIDLGPTFLDFAGVLETAPPGMSTFSLRGVLQTPQTVSPPRTIVEFGLNNFRGVVRTINDWLSSIDIITIIDVLVMVLIYRCSISLL